MMSSAMESLSCAWEIRLRTSGRSFAANGGHGGDLLTGGSDADTFKFASVQDSLKLWGLFDTITDFKKGEDKLDFHLIDANEGVAGDQKFTLVSYGGSNQVLGAGQMTAHFDAELGKTIIEANVDGDASNEFHLELDGIVVPNASDMIM
jgi:Ca2+-binding RTX toxin-like protein